MAIRKTQEENKALEEETRKMEQRLQMLKSVLYKDMPKDVGNNYAERLLVHRYRKDPPIRPQLTKKPDEANATIAPEIDVVDEEEPPRTPKPDAFEWHPNDLYATRANPTDELTTIELIKQHLNRMTMDRQ
ncbi:unnamed protein product [Echinostoma caproni]|uniref:Spindle and centriole-associated protein 1 n=1 Tax=Echinostoma caproni TaxID=27848 RepID=A0A183B135_9TREM|nr:unnamed protein product [Echinostoma caproni]